MMIKEILTGFIISVLTTLAGSYIYLEYFSLGGSGFERNWAIMVDTLSQGYVLTYGALPNILLFFVFLKKKQDYRARGVMLSIILTTFVVFFYNFLM